MNCETPKWKEQTAKGPSAMDISQHIFSTCVFTIYKIVIVFCMDGVLKYIFIQFVFQKSRIFHNIFLQPVFLPFMRLYFAWTVYSNTFLYGLYFRLNRQCEMLSGTQLKPPPWILRGGHKTRSQAKTIEVLGNRPIT